MCCIFTCCGWMVDLIQRLWTFTMSCIISSAVCCSLVISSMSGVALGYNYSLAEYIDLKETNVSVYLKRGVFDDEIADDIDWRRSGHQSVDGHLGENNLMTGASDEATTLRSGRRLDDSVYESNDRHNYEGGLMKLTAKPPGQRYSVRTTERTLGELLTQYEMGSLDQLKAVQGVVNMKKAEAEATRRPPKIIQETPTIIERRPPPPFPADGRRAMFNIPNFERPTTYSSLRAAVPDDQINEPSKWTWPKLSPHLLPRDEQYVDFYQHPTYPSPVTPRAGPLRPTRPRVLSKLKPGPASIYATPPSIKPSRSPEMNLPKSIDDDMEVFKKKLMDDKFIPPMIKDDDFLKQLDLKSKTNEDYEDEIKGVPMRKKRNINISTLKESINNDNNTSKEDLKDVLKISSKLSNADIKGQVSIISYLMKTNLNSGSQERKVSPTLTNFEMTPTNIIKILSSAIS